MVCKQHANEFATFDETDQLERAWVGDQPYCNFLRFDRRHSGCLLGLDGFVSNDQIELHHSATLRVIVALNDSIIGSIWNAMLHATSKTQSIY